MIRKRRQNLWRRRRKNRKRARKTGKKKKRLSEKKIMIRLFNEDDVLNGLFPLAPSLSLQSPGDSTS